MAFTGTALCVAIAIIYNIFIHHLTSLLYRNHPFKDKFSNTLTTLFVAGVAGVVIGKVFLEDQEKYKNSPVSRGLYAGGILLIITSLFVNWENMGEELRLIMMGLVLGALIWFSYKYIDGGEEEDDELDEILKDSGNEEQ